VEAGSREVVLLGQTVDSYRDPGLPAPESDDPDETQFPALLRLIAREVPSLARLRYTSPHPRHATPALATAHAELDVLARHVHLPAQSGSDRVLRRMIRRYTRAEYLERSRRLLAARDGMTLSTDVIVGFPGETEEDFAATLSLVREAKVTQLFGFKYSPRPKTPALRLGDDVPEEVKSDRLSRLFALVEELGSAHLARLVGTTQRVLVEGPSKDAQRGTVQGRTERNEIVHVAAGPDVVGHIVEVVVLRANRHSLVGELTGDARAAARSSDETPRPRATKRTLPLLA
jgi:tRNA-2-methylthio-N6-dimethylallyladenosine synthase